MKLNILVLDDNLDSVPYELKEALRLYTGIDGEIFIPNFYIDPSPKQPLKIPAKGSRPAVSVYFTANRRRDNLAELIVSQINTGRFDAGDWDAIILDNNWAGSEADMSGVSNILGELISRKAIMASRPEILILTWHYKDPSFHRKVSEAIEPFRNIANLPIRPVAKGSFAELADWIGEMIRIRLERRFNSSLLIRGGRPDGTTIGERSGVREEHRNCLTSAPLEKKFKVKVLEDGEIIVNDETAGLSEGASEWMRFLFFLLYCDVPVVKPSDVQGCLNWFQARRDGSDPEKGRLSQNFLERLERAPVVPPSLFRADSDLSKALVEFREKYDCGAVKKGAGGNGPEVIKKATIVLSFELKA